MAKKKLPAVAAMGGYYMQNNSLPESYYSLQAEQSVIGGLILNNEAFEEVNKKIKVEDFYRPEHKVLFNALINLSKENKPFDILILVDELKKADKLQEAGGETYIFELVHNTPSPANVIFYADIVQKKACERGFNSKKSSFKNKDIKQILQEDIEYNEKLLERLNSDNQNSNSLTLHRVLDMQSKPFDWLWEGKIFKGKVTLFAGLPGIGKSLLTTDLAATISTGGKFPGDSSNCEKGSVIILSGEDTPEDAIRPRLQAAGADLSKIHIMSPFVRKNKKNVPFSLKTDLPVLDKLLFLEKYKDVSSIVIDPILQFLAGVDIYKGPEVQQIIMNVANLAEKHSIAIIFISHLNKSVGQIAQQRVVGSYGFLASVRSAFFVLHDKDDPRKRVILPVKNNYGNDRTGLAFVTEDCAVENNIKTCRIKWLDEVVTATANEMMNIQDFNKKNSAIEEAKEFLIDLFSEFPNGILQKNIKAECKEAGISWATVRRAKEILGIKSKKLDMDQGWLWEMPTKVLNNDEGAHSKIMSTFKESEHLQEKIEDVGAFSDNKIFDKIE